MKRGDKVILAPKRMDFKGRTFISLTVLCAIFFSISQVAAITCHECGNMYDGTSFMGIEDFRECQFFEHDIAEDNQEFLVQCPQDDTCCFALREHLTMEFWGHAAAAEVLVRGCCSKLNQTKHHLASSTPPPLVTDMKFRAEILSQTVQNEAVKTRVLFCNTLGCNKQRVPWSKPVKINAEASENVRSLAPSKSKTTRTTTTTTTTVRPRMKAPTRRQSLSEEQSLLALFEKFRTSVLVDKPAETEEYDMSDYESTLSDYGDRNMRKRPQLTIPSKTFPMMEETRSSDVNSNPLRPLSIPSKKSENTATSTSEPYKCECNCNCPSLVCPTYQLSATNAGFRPVSLLIPYCFSLVKEYL